MSFSIGFIHFLLVFCSSCHLALSQCGEVELTVSTPWTKFDDTYFTYVGETKATYIQCKFACGSCEKEYIYWLKDGAAVYTSFLDNSGRISGPEPDYSHRIESVDDIGNDTYVLKWNETAWEDLPAPHTPTTWQVYVKADICTGKPAEGKIEYYNYPYLTYHANGDVVEEYDAVKNISSGTVNCMVLSHPTCNITLMHHDEVISNDSSCSPYDQFESICSLSVDYVNMIQGVHCKVEYDSPETGNMTVVIPDGCCPNGLYPSVPPEQRGCSGLCWWEWLLIALGCVGLVGVMSATGVMVKKKKGRTADQHSDASYQPSDNPSMQPEDVEIKPRPNQRNEGVNANRSEEEKM